MKAPPPLALRERIYARLGELGITPSEFLARAHGRGPNGDPRASGPFYAALKGTGAVTQGRLHQWAEALEIPVEELVALTPAENFTQRGRPRGPYKPRRPATPKPKPKPKPKSAAQLLAQVQEARVELPPGPSPNPRATPTHAPQFSLVVDQAGLATLRLNLVDVPIDDAMKVITTLTTIGLFRGR